MLKSHSINAKHNVNTGDDVRNTDLHKLCEHCEKNSIKKQIRIRSYRIICLAYAPKNNSHTFSKKSDKKRRTNKRTSPKM